MPVLRCHPDCHVTFGVIRPAGFRILGAIDRVARTWVRDLYLTSGTDGTHIGTPDPHLLGEAYDLMSHDCVSIGEKQDLVKHILLELLEAPGEALVAASSGWATDHFFGFLEQPGQAGEHIHVQRRKGQVYP
jgi:hypothetical protein